MSVGLARYCIHDYVPFRPDNVETMAPFAEIKAGINPPPRTRVIKPLRITSFVSGTKPASATSDSTTVVAAAAAAVVIDSELILSIIIGNCVVAVVDVVVLVVVKARAVGSNVIATVPATATTPTKCTTNEGSSIVVFVRIRILLLVGCLGKIFFSLVVVVVVMECT